MHKQTTPTYLVRGKQEKNLRMHTAHNLGLVQFLGEVIAFVENNET